jgi:uncharacterized protein YecT (DUF1311 family)
VNNRFIISSRQAFSADVEFREYRPVQRRQGACQMPIFRKKSMVISAMHAARLSFVVGWLIVSSLAKAAATDWPEGYIVDEDSQSPDEKYGILIPSRETAENDDSVADTNYLADLTTHRLLGKIKDADYFQGQNHAGLSVTWAEDSKLAIVDYEGRFGFGSIIVIEPKASGFAQTEIGTHIQKAIDAVIAKQAHVREAGGYANAMFRFERGRKIRVYATALTNPKQLEEAKSYFALFQGLFDLPAKKWIKSTARPLTADENDLLDQASTTYETDKFKVSTDAFKNLDASAEEPQFSGNDVLFRSEESEFKYVDAHMNDAYKAARFILTPAEFAKVKADQLEWLKKRDAAGSIAEKSKLTMERTKALQEVAW